MKKRILALSVLVLAMAQPAVAQIPNLTSVTTSTGVPLGVPNTTADYTFDQSGLNGSFTGSSGTGWTLSVSGTNNTGAFYTPGSSTPISTLTGSTYSLSAVFNNAGVLQSGSLAINGSISGGVNQLLLSESLTGFGVNASQASVGFSTQFTGGLYDAPQYTGGSLGDVTYLFDQGGVYTGSGVLSNLIGEFQSAWGGNTNAFVAVNSFSGNVSSLAAVPLPLPAILFGTGLTALMGLGRRQRRNQA